MLDWEPKYKAALETETDPARIGDILEWGGNLYFSAFVLGKHEPHENLIEARDAFARLTDLYPNHLPARNQLAAITLIIEKTNPAAALPYLEKIDNPILRCRPDDDLYLFPPSLGDKEPVRKLNPIRRFDLHELKIAAVKSSLGFDEPFEYHESERRVLRGMAIWMSGDPAEGRKMIESVFADPEKMVLFPHSAEVVARLIEDRMDSRMLEILRTHRMDGLRKLKTIMDNFPELS